MTMNRGHSLRLTLGRLAILLGIAFWALGGLGLILYPEADEDAAIGIYLLVMQLIALQGYRKWRAENQGAGRYMLLGGLLLSMNIIALTGWAMLALSRSWLHGLMRSPHKMPKPSLPSPRLRSRLRTPKLPLPLKPSEPPMPSSPLQRRKPMKRDSRVVEAGIEGRASVTSRVYKLIGTPIKSGLKQFNCSGPNMESCLPGVVAPPGYEGCWKVCLLGCGGWGCAYHAARGRESVVFKIPRGLEGILSGEPPTVSEKLLERAVREAEAIEMLRHPHLLRLLAYSKTAPLLVYEYADQGPLSWQLGQGWKPSLEEVLLMAYQLGDALRYIHSRGLVHGDIKPGNVFIAGGVVKLGDFSGVTRLLSQASTHPTQAYTPGWRAPEQVYSDLRRRSVERGYENRVDVYQLGNLLLYLLTGEHIDGEEAVARPGKVEEVLEHVDDPGLRGLLASMLAPEPWSRPGMDEVVSRLSRMLERRLT